MSQQQQQQRSYDDQFNHADVNHDGGVDQQEFRQFLGPVRDERRLSGNLSAQDVQHFSAHSSQDGEIVSYPVGLDVAVAGFTQNPIEYEKFTSGANAAENHTYGLGPDVGIGAPNVARKSNQYDPAAAMFDYADVNHDGRIDKQEFGSFMRSV
ncbi:unnamed protein product [Adineta steineri]|uniref:EF-hand domain-containing protein n=1 Tax=Adineta steineri TaxID=433720 RepID=A0A818I385_9BILA|nr:unnamed protein product [Adineta steineri]CAF3512837.1 unnamed protein product [Adineta steineri]